MPQGLYLFNVKAFRVNNEDGSGMEQTPSLAEEIKAMGKVWHMLMGLRCMRTHIHGI